MDNFDRHSVFSLASTEAAPACLARRHSRWLSFCLDRRYSSTSLPPLAPSPLRDFTATMEALTPIRPALRSLHEHRLFGEQVSLIHVSDLPTPPSPTTPQALDVDFARYPSSRRVSCLRRSRLHHFPAGSPTLTGRIEFVFLRMDRSPPVAPHPASRRRSYSWLQAGERIPEEDSHLSDQTRFQAHWNARSARVFSQTEGLALLCPPYEGGPQGVSGILDTPCRKVRGVPLAKGDKRRIETPEQAGGLQAISRW